MPTVYSRLRSRRLTTTLSAALGAALLGSALVPTAAVAAEGSRVVINEAYLKGGSANAPYKNKFVELYNAGDAAQDLSGWSLQYRPAAQTGNATSSLALTGSIAAGAYYLIGLPSNGSVGEALPATDASSSSLNPAGASGQLWLASTTTAIAPPAGNVVGAVDVVDFLGYGDAAAFETAPAAVTGGNGTPNSLVRTGFADTNDNSADFTNATTVTPQSSTGGVPPEPETPEPGTPDPETPEPGTPEPGTVTAIRDIQGTGTVSPLNGATVTTRGVVTATYPTGGFDGFYLQTAGTGGELDLAAHAASDAIFVYGGAAAGKVAAGHYVEVTGTVGDYYGLTQISASSASAVTVLTEQAAAVTPAAVEWPRDEAQRRSLEGMLLAPQGTYTVTNTYDTNRYGSVGLAFGDEPLIQPTEVARPGTAAYNEVVADNAARAVLLDDGSTVDFTGGAANKNIPLPYLSLDAPVRVGAEVTFTKPVVLDYRYEKWGFQPTQVLTGANAADAQPATFANTRTARPADVGGDVKIASFNVLNYFTTLPAAVNCTNTYKDRDGTPITANCSGNGPRGAATGESLKRQQDKIFAAINALGADVVSLEEIENSAAYGKNRDAALGTLVAALNTGAGSEVWSFVPSPTAVPASEDVIRTAFIYKKSAVETVGTGAILDSSAFSNARQPLAQAFKLAGADDDDAFVAIANHFKSKGSGSGENADKGDGQGASNASRVAQATALAAFSEQMQTEYNTELAFLLGDFNSYTQEDPMQVLYAAGYESLGSQTDKYSYSFSGLSGSLDHVLASEAAQDIVSGTDIWNINAGESIALEYSRYNYNVSNLYDASPYRSSDHDPVIVGLDLSGGATPEPPVDTTTDINLLGINDFHGRIDANTVKFAGTVEQLRAEYGDENTLFLSNGDNIGASLFASAYFDDEPTIDVLNALELAASATGNHEFDKGADDLTGRVSTSADFPYLAANVFTDGEPLLDEYAIFEVDGIRVGVIGAVTQETSQLVSPGGIEGLEFREPVAEVNRVVEEIADRVDVIVAQYHEGAAEGDSTGETLEQAVAAGGAFAKIVTETDAEVDAIFTGHTHQKYAWEAPIPGREGTRPIVQTGSYGENIGQVVLTVDEDGDVVEHTARNVARLAAETVADDPAKTAENSAALDAKLIATYPRVAEVDEIVRAARAEADRVGAEPVGSVTADITTAFRGGSFVDGVYVGGQRDDRSKQSALGGLVADALLTTLADPDRGGAEIGIVNPGGLRAELLYGEDGVITLAEANAVLPFVNNLWTTTLTGDQLRQALEQQWGDEAQRDRDLALGVSENVRVTYDAARGAGERITGIWIDGEAVDPAGEYRVGSFSFLLQGGDAFAALGQGANTRDSGLIDRDGWIDYLRANPGLSPDYAVRSVQVSGAADPVERGDELTLTVSNLDLTSLGSPANTSLAISGVQAEVPVVGGTATVTVPVADDAPEAFELTLTAQPSGTTVTVPVLTVAPGTVEPGPGEGENPGTGEGENPGTGEGGTPGTGEGTTPGPGEGTTPGIGSGAGSGAGTGTGSGSGSDTSTGTLPLTGSDAAWMGGAALAAMLLIGLGVVARRSGARRAD